MNFKEIFDKLIKYNDKNNYYFSLMPQPDNSSIKTPEVDYKVFPNIKENLDFLKSKYNVLICPDIIIREFNMFANNKDHKCFIICIDGLFDSISINDFILEPTGGIDLENFKEILVTVLNCGVKKVIPHVYSSIIDKESGNTRIEDVRKLLSIIKEVA